METSSIQSYSGNTVLNKVLLSIGLLLVLWNTCIIPIPETIQWIFFAATILIAGIPHGALDHLVAQENSSLQKQSFSSTQFYLTYLSRMALYGICWYFFPSFALLLFIVLSAFHFGETDIPVPTSVPKQSAVILQTCYGLLMILVLLFTHAEEVLPILSTIEKQNATFLSMIFTTQTSLSIIAVVVSACIFYCIRLQKNHGLSIHWLLNILFRTLVILGIIVSLPLPLAFAFYFGVWHSVHSLENIRQHLSSSQSEHISCIGLLKKCIPFSVIAFVGIGVLMLFATYLQTESVFLFFFFVGIAILTAPHLEVMSHMYQHLRKKDSVRP
jgi:Brp/Blh family beta-carotene 15,15'-monooxygenase